MNQETMHGIRYYNPKYFSVFREDSRGTIFRSRRDEWKFVDADVGRFSDIFSLMIGLLRIAKR